MSATDGDVVVYGPVKEGEPTISGGIYPMDGWGWCCGDCKQSGFGYASADEASQYADAHPCHPRAVEALGPWLHHDDGCDLADPVSDDDAARYYAETGRLPADDECSCGLADALAGSPRPSGLSEGHQNAINGTRLLLADPPHHSEPGAWEQREALLLDAIDRLSSQPTPGAERPEDEDEDEPPAHIADCWAFSHGDPCVCGAAPERRGGGQ